MRFSMALVIPLVIACSKPDATPATPTSATPDVVTTAKPPAGQAPVTGKAEVGQPAPEFELSGLDGAKVKLSDHKGKIVVIEWFNPDCPYVRQAHGIGSLKGMAAKVKDKHGEVVWLAVNSGAAGKQGHGEETNRAGKEKFGIGYPILFDTEGTVGQAYGATNTPHMYVIDKTGTLVYAGALDNTRSGDPEDAEPELINYVADALEDLSAGKSVRTPKTEAWGCSVKYARK
jgi:peroxiredoxin